MRNMMKGIVSLLLAVCMLALPVLSLAEGEPTLDGVRDQSVMAGTEFDALDGVTAADAAGGDLTDMIMIESTPRYRFRRRCESEDAVMTASARWMARWKRPECFIWKRDIASFRRIFSRSPSEAPSQ